MNKLSFLLLITFLILTSSGFSQGTVITPSQLSGQSEVNIISTAVPFLTITPDARAGSMGELGVATSPDENSLYWNPAKYAFIDKAFGGTFSYTPWLRSIVNDISLSYLSAYKRIDDNQTIAGSLRYFSMGKIDFTSESGQFMTVYNPNEFSLDFAYALKLSENLSGGIALRYIYSSLTGGYANSSSGGTTNHPGQTVAADISFYHRGSEFSLMGKNASISTGINISNIGPKISYTDVKQFIPTNLRVGSVLTSKLDGFNELSWGIDLNKLMVPTPNGTPTDKVPVSTGIFKSFTDAPGGFSEELHEITISSGLEYTYAKQFALRAGGFYESQSKGNRKYFTVGMGLKYSFLGLDFSYLMPVNQNNPLENTIRFSLFINFGDMKSKSSPKNDEQ